ncbi:MAG: flagellar hook-basal body complex protein FliE [Candidatus Eremiobacteraeota bacterium]|nr:flagellar hook-basal body complex protein FliE [Candidatus Eremiobacteraeota bacterium]
MSVPFEGIAPINTASMSPMSTGMQVGKSLFAKEEEGSKFENLFANYMNTANATLNKAKDLGDKVATGDLGSIHKLSVAGMKAEIMLKLTTQIAAKLSSATTTLFQMQM